MKIDTFKVEKWMNEYENYSKFDLANTTVATLSFDELFELTSTDKTDFLNKLCENKQGYGFITGNPELKKGISNLYESIIPEDIIPTIGAAGANHLVFYSLIEPDDRVITVIPTYQQLYSIPESFGANVELMFLKRENNFLPDLKELKKLAKASAKMICINNPNNPTGALIPPKILEEIVEIAREADAYLLCDEVYRGLTSVEASSPSIADLYEKGISTGSMSKVFSLAGLRLGWVASKSKEAVDACLKHREYNMISCSITDEFAAALALEHSEKIIERNRKIIKENLEILDNWVKKERHITYVKPEAGTTALLYYDFEMSSKDFCKGVSDKYGVFLTPGFCFELENCFRVGFCKDKQTLSDGLEKISQYILELKGN